MFKSGEYTQLAPVLFGKGMIKKVVDVVNKCNVKKVLLVTDKFLSGKDFFIEIKSSLEDAGIEVSVWTDVVGECPDYILRDGASFAKEKDIDGIIGIGGGSSLDSAKALSVLIPNGEAILDEIPAYLSGSKKYPNPQLPVILIPTNSGTGSEVTFVAVITDSITKGKIGLPCPPTYAIIDPGLMVGSPSFVTAVSGLDAMSHAIESLCEVKHTPHSDLLAYEAIRLIAEWLPIACNDIDNIEAREKLAFASNIAGISFSESGVHVGHSFAHSLGYHYHIPHGHACAIMTPPTIEFIAKEYPDKVREIGKLMGLDLQNVDNGALGKRVADEVRKLMKEVEIPSLESTGITRDQALDLVQFSVNEPLCMQYDGTITKNDLIEVITSAYDHYK